MKPETAAIYKRGAIILVPLAAIGLRFCVYAAGKSTPRPHPDPVAIGGKTDPELQREIDLAIASAEHEKMARKRAAAMPTAAPGASSDVVAAGVPLPDAIAVDDENVYWTSTTSGAVQAAPRGGGPAVTLSKGHKMLFPRHAQVLAVAGGSVYFATRDGRGYGAVMRVPAAGGDAEALTPEVLGITSLAARGKDVVFTRAATGASRDPDGNPSGGLYRALGKGEDPKLLVPLERPCASALDGKAAFAVDALAIVGVPVAGGEPERVVRSVARLGCALVVDEKDLYYVVPGDDSVMRAPKDGSGARVFAVQRSRPSALALDGDFVYSLTESAPQALGEMGTVYRTRRGGGASAALVIDEVGLNGVGAAGGAAFYTRYDESEADGRVVRVAAPSGSAGAGSTAPTGARPERAVTDP